MTDTTTPQTQISGRDINQVRQILTNEMGLTRETIRDIAQHLIEREAEKTVNAMLANGVLDKLVEKAVNNKLSANRYERDALGRLISTAAAEQVKGWLAANLQFKGTPADQPD